MSFAVVLVILHDDRGVDDRETNPPLGFKSIALIFLVPAGIQIQSGLRDS